MAIMNIMDMGSMTMSITDMIMGMDMTDTESWSLPIFMRSTVMSTIMNTIITIITQGCRILLR